MLIVACLWVNAISSLAIITENSTKFILFHSSDIHGQFEEIQGLEIGPIGGCARVAHVIKQARRDSNEGRGYPLLYLDSGNVYVGDLWFSVHRDKIVTAFMNALKPDAMCIGPHEFDFGIRGLLPFLQNARFPVVVSNLHFKDPNIEKLIKKWHILNLKGKMIGIVGYLTSERAAFVADTGRASFIEEEAAVRRAAEKLTKVHGVDIIIALGHASYNTDIKIAKLVNEVDIVVGGHVRDENIHLTVVKRSNGVEVPVINGYDNTNHLGQLRVAFDEKGVLQGFEMDPIFLDYTVPEDPDVLGLLETFRYEVNVVNTTVVGRSQVFLDGISCRYGECNFGNLITDSFVLYNAKRYASVDWQWTDAALALINAGAIRKNIDTEARGHIVFKSDLLEALPHNNALYKITLTGGDLLSSLEHGASGYTRRDRAKFLVTSGLKIFYDFNREPGERVRSVEAKCAECALPKYSRLDPAAEYKIVTTEYLVRSGDDHSVININARDPTPLEGTAIDAIIEYFGRFDDVIPQIDGRIMMGSDGFSLKLDAYKVALLTSLIFLAMFTGNRY